MKPKKLKIVYVTRAGVELTLEFPARFEVCHRCEGSGSHVNPAIDGHGISPDEFEADPDFAEAYFSGRYDIRCEVCGGERLLEVIDHERLSPKQARRWAIICEQKREAERDYESEAWLRRAESGERY